MTKVIAADDKVQIDGYDAVSYASSTFKNQNGVTLNKDDFEALVVANEGKIRVTAVKDANGVYAFEIVTVNASDDAALNAVNSATSVAGVETALSTNKAVFASDWDELTTGQQTDVATVVFNNRLNGYTISSLKAAYETGYATEVTQALAAADAANAALTFALLDAVPGLNVTALEALPTAGGYQAAAIDALEAAK